jgi:NAD-dependent deacetylase
VPFRECAEISEGLKVQQGNIVILTGAGISKESGLDTFRDADGIWSQVKLEDVATPEAFHRDPALVHRFYNARRETLRSGNIKPNAAHFALALLEREWKGDVTLVTQNVDDLHQRAGSRNVIPMHGELMKARCPTCNLVMAWPGPLTIASQCPSCRFEGLRPHVVWFGEVPFEMRRIHAALDQADLFVTIGTSGTVYPAAGLIAYAHKRGVGRCVELNLEPGDGSRLFDERIYGRATDVVPAWVEKLLT